MSWETLWKIILAWFVLVMAVLALAGDLRVPLFGITFGLVFGGICWMRRAWIREFIGKSRLDGFRAFIAVALLISAFEEAYCYLLGNHIAYPDIFIDIPLVLSAWLPWFCLWYFYFSKKYAFSEKEALFTAACTGVLFEFVGSLAIIQNPFSIMAAPLAIVVYAAIFVVPMQFIEFSGKEGSWIKYPVAIILPYLAAIPLIFAWYFLLGMF